MREMVIPPAEPRRCVGLAVAVIVVSMEIIGVMIAVVAVVAVVVMVSVGLRVVIV